VEANDTQSEVKTPVTKETEPNYESETAEDLTSKDPQSVTDPMQAVINSMQEAEDAVSKAINDMADQII
jgi:hypothetical protein